PDEPLDQLNINVEQRSERADIDDVLEQLALARVGVALVADCGQRHADGVDVASELALRNGSRGIVEEVASGLYLPHILVPGLGIHRDHQVDAAAAATAMASLGHPDFIPGRKALDVGGKDVARGHRYAHAQDRAG